MTQLSLRTIGKFIQHFIHQRKISKVTKFQFKIISRSRVLHKNIPLWYIVPPSPGANRLNTILKAARNSVECALGNINALWAIFTINMDFRLGLFPILRPTRFVFYNVFKIECCHLICLQCKLAEEEKLKNIHNSVYSSANGDDEFVRSVLT